VESETFYVVVRGLDGSLVTLTEIPDEGITATRTANTGDVYETAKQIVHEVDTNDLALRHGRPGCSPIFMADIRMR
jgi:hypothetical protein